MFRISDIAVILVPVAGIVKITLPILIESFAIQNVHDVLVIK